MRDLLKATARDGASDLRRPTGARPFIRNHREFEFMGAEPLTANDALRLNNILLAAELRARTRLIPGLSENQPNRTTQMRQRRTRGLLAT
jgi:Tfp pilus assembly pilus retraction ATPase PilT